MEKKAKILVVDDSVGNLMLMEGILIQEGYEVVLGHNGEEAIEKVEDFSPDVMLLDIKMPKLNGFEVAKRIKGNEKTMIIPIVIVTGLGDVKNRILALRAGADDFLTKPVEKTELIARVRSLVKVKAYNDYQRNYQKQLEIEVAKRTNQLRYAFEKIKDASIETIHRLARAAEYKDEDTGAHIQRMSSYAVAVARKMDQTKETIDALLKAAPMHDVGKIGIPDRILLKPGKLEKDEWRIMKQHTTIGSKILKGSTSVFIKSAEEIALTHHEKWDGTGYPQGLKGSEIPVAGHITAIADVFDALTSKRPYKDPFSLDKSFNIIKENRGTHFNPEVVDAFFDIENDILDIKEKYKDKGRSILFQMAVNES